MALFRSVKGENMPDKARKRETNRYRFEKLRRDGSVWAFAPEEINAIKRLAKKAGMQIEISESLDLRDSDLLQVRWIKS